MKKTPPSPALYRYQLNRMTQDSWQMFRLMGELALGFDRMGQVTKPFVTVYGSARTPITHRYYALAEELGRLLAQEDFAVVTGGGPGIMEAANKGAFETGGISIGVNIALPDEQLANHYQTFTLMHEYFHTRKMVLARYSVGFVVFPGGFGTLDELTEILTMIQTQKLDPFPIFLVSSSYWTGLVDWFRDTLAQEAAIAPDDLNLFRIVDDVGCIPGLIKHYHDTERDSGGFKIPGHLDRKRALGLG